ARHAGAAWSFLTGSGGVRALQGDSALLAVGDVADWPALTAALQQADSPETPAGKLWQAFPETVKAIVRGGVVSARSTKSRAEMAALADLQQEVGYGLHRPIQRP